MLIKVQLLYSFMFFFYPIAICLLKMGKSWIGKRKLESELDSVSNTTPEERKALEEERHNLCKKSEEKHYETVEEAIS